MYGPADDLVIVRFVLAEPNDFKGFGMAESAWSATGPRSRLVWPRSAPSVATDPHRGRRLRLPGHHQVRGRPQAAGRLPGGHPGCQVLSLGNSLEIIKDLGDANTVHEQYGLAGIRGSHGIGHVRMATESDVDLASAHPYWAYPFADVAVVHNGQLTNYHHVAPPPGADGPPVPVRVRFGDHRRVPGPASRGRRAARDGHEAQPRRLRRRVHLSGGHRQRVGHRQGRDGGQAAGA